MTGSFIYSEVTYNINKTYPEVALDCRRRYCSMFSITLTDCLFITTEESSATAVNSQV